MYDGVVGKREVGSEGRDRWFRQPERVGGGGKGGVEGGGKERGEGREERRRRSEGGWMEEREEGRKGEGEVVR